MPAFLTEFAAVCPRRPVRLRPPLLLRAPCANLSYSGLQHYLWANRILYKDFARRPRKGHHALEEASLRQAQQLGREFRYLNSTQPPKKTSPGVIAARDRIRKWPRSACSAASIRACRSR